MPIFTIQYRNIDDQTIKQETLFMKSLSAAKTSTPAFAPNATDSIVIFDDLGLKIATKRNGKWSKES